MSGCSQHLLNLLLIEIFAFIQTTEVFQHDCHRQIQKEVRADYNAANKVNRTYVDIVSIAYEVENSRPSLQSH